MDGSVSTLAPLFAAAFATRNPWETFLVGLAASLGAGISMGFAEALSDDGSLTGRGRPWTRGFVCGLMTALGGLGHTLPYPGPLIVGQRLLDRDRDRGRCRVRRIMGHRLYSRAIRGTPNPQAVFQITLGGAIVLAVGILICFGGGGGSDNLGTIVQIRFSCTALPAG